MNDQNEKVLAQEEEKEESLKEQLEEILERYARKEFPNEARLLRFEISFPLMALEEREWRVYKKNDHVLVVFGVMPGKDLVDGVKGAVGQAVRVVREARKVAWEQDPKIREHRLVVREIDSSVCIGPPFVKFEQPSTLEWNGKKWIAWGEVETSHLEAGRVYQLK